MIVGRWQKRAKETSSSRGWHPVFFTRSGTHIILPTATVAAGTRSPGAHCNKSSGRGPPGSRFSALSEEAAITPVFGVAGTYGLGSSNEVDYDRRLPGSPGPVRTREEIGRR